MAEQIELSVIIPITEHVNDVSELYKAYKNEVYSCFQKSEIIFVLDGDFPEVFEELKSLKRDEKEIQIIRLARGFGKATALTAGFESSSGNVILTLPARYQIKPSGITKLINEFNDCDMVIGKRWPRIDSPFNRIQAKALNSILNFFAGSSFEDLGCDVRLFKRQVMEEVPIYGGQDRFFPVLASHRGFRIKEVNVEQSERDKFWRIHRLSNYPVLVIDIIAVFFLVKFTKKPLRFFGGIGTAIFVIGGFFMTYIVFERLFGGVPLADRPALLLSSLLVVLGTQIFALGLIGELIIFTHARDIKEYTIAEIIN